MAEDYRNEIEALAELYSYRGYKVLKKWIEDQLSGGFEKLLRKKTEETRGELAAELRAYKKVLIHVEEAWKQKRL